MVANGRLSRTAELDLTPTSILTESSKDAQHTHPSVFLPVMSSPARPRLTYDGTR